MLAGAGSEVDVDTGWLLTVVLGVQADTNIEAANVRSAAFNNPFFMKILPLELLLF